MHALASYIDHTLLKPDATLKQIKDLCHETVEYQFHSVCVNPYWVSTARKELIDSPVKVCTVIGFPLGNTFQKVKIGEAVQAKILGADEFDMVMNISAVKRADWDYGVLSVSVRDFFSE